MKLRALPVVVVFLLTTMFPMVSTHAATTHPVVTPAMLAPVTCRTWDGGWQVKMWQTINANYYLLAAHVGSFSQGGTRNFLGTACNGDGLYIGTRTCALNFEVVDGGLIDDDTAYLLLYCSDPSVSMKIPLDIDYTANGSPVYSYYDRRWWGYTDFVNGRECFPTSYPWACP
jgi:hypothetical protein